MTMENDENNTHSRNARLLIDDYDEPKTSGSIIGYAQEPLLPLAEACAPLVQIVHDIPKYVSIALKNTPQEPFDGLTRDESAAIRLYTMEWSSGYKSLYFILNKTLETADREHLRPWFKYLKLFLTALVQIQCIPLRTVWRGVRRDISDQFPPGAQVTWWTFSSCTTTLTVLENTLYLGREGPRTLFSIEVFNGRKITSHSKYFGEDEVLLLPGTYMEVQSQFSPAPDLHVIHLRQMMPQEILCEPPFEGAQLYPTNDADPRHSKPAVFSTEEVVQPTTLPWYKKKWIIISICLMILACLLAVILGSALGTRSSTSIPVSRCQLTFASMVSYSTGSRRPDSIAVGDLNNDSALDLAVAFYNGENTGIFLGYGNGTFANQAIFPTGYNPWSVTIADFNNDNRSDIAVTNGREGNVGILFGYGNGTFATQTKLPTGNDPWAIAIGDFNNDNQLDLAAANGRANNISILLNYGNGNFANQTTYATGILAVSLATGDFNNDTHLDIVVVNFNNNSIGILLGYGNGSFAPQETYSTGKQPTWVAVGDLNNDNQLDIVVTNEPDGNTSVLLGYGNGTFAAQTTFSTGLSPQAVILRDCNKDNQLDIVVVNKGSSSISILLGYGNGSFAEQVTFLTGSSPQGITMGDFNGDHLLDIAVANMGGNTVGILLNTCYCCIS